MCSAKLVLLKNLLVQIERISGIASKYVGKAMHHPYTLALPAPLHASHDPNVGSFGMQLGFSGEMYGAAEILRSMPGHVPDADKPTIIELAIVAMDELIRMATVGEPLWTPAYDGSTHEILSDDEYFKMFPRGIGPRPTGMSSEATRGTTVVIMTNINLVEIFMDVVR